MIINLIRWGSGHAFNFTVMDEQVVANISKVFPQDTEAPPGGVDDMTKLSYLHEPGVLQNLATRYELNEIYVSFTVSFEFCFILKQVVYMLEL